MLTLFTFGCDSQMPQIESGATAGVSQLIAAAVVDSSFKSLLLTNPSHALENGYHGQIFSLTPREQELILSIRASSLADFSRQVLAYRTRWGDSSKNKT